MKKGFLIFLAVTIVIVIIIIGLSRECSTDKIEFYPKKFHQVRLVDGDVTYEETECTPRISDFRGSSKLNKIHLNCPERVVYRIDNIQEMSNTYFVLPICIHFSRSDRMSSRYSQLRETIYIKKINTNEWRHGVVESLSFFDESSFLPTEENAALNKRFEREIKEVQNYSEEELYEEKTSGLGGMKNFNLFDFVTFPLTSGRYIVYYSFEGLESNRRFVDIIIEEK